MRTKLSAAAGIILIAGVAHAQMMGEASQKSADKPAATPPAATSPSTVKPSTMQPDPPKATATTAAPATVIPEAAGPPDPVLDEAAALVARPLILRCLCADSALHYDAHGKLEGSPQKPVDWTLAGVNVQKFVRKSPTEVELNGIRMIETFAADRQEFDRRPMREEKIVVTIADAGDPVAFKKALSEIFSDGIDRRLQATTPDYWQHYFDPNLQWPADGLTGKTPYAAGPQVSGPAVTQPVAVKQEALNYTPVARQLRVKGASGIRAVIDPTGTPKHVAILQPLGFGLDESAVKAVDASRFKPGTLNGAPVPVLIRVGVNFDPPPAAQGAPKPQPTQKASVPTM